MTSLNKYIHFDFCSGQNLEAQNCAKMTLLTSPRIAGAFSTHLFTKFDFVVVMLFILLTEPCSLW